MYWTRRITWPAWKFGVLKLSMIAFGILMGSYFPDFFRPWQIALWAIFGVTAAILSVWGFQAMYGPSSREDR